MIIIPICELIYSHEIIKIRSKRHKKIASKNIVLSMDVSPRRIESSLSSQKGTLFHSVPGNLVDDSSSKTKTKKNKKLISNIDKKKLWDIFDNEKTEKENAESKSNPQPLECIYEKKEVDLCHLCNSMLMIMDDGFPTCTNPKCCIIYKNTLDYSPEWRFYGADDKFQ